MKHNFLRDAKSISNSELCRYDSINGYFTDFSNNGDVNGWDIYNNIYMYGCWNNILFGSSYLPSCYISRNEVFLSVNAEEYFYIEFILKVIDENPDRTIKGLNKGKIMWLRSDDVAWSDDRAIEFDITGVGTWEYYKLNLGPYKWWQGDINNLRFYPFIDGHTGDKFFLKSLKITSEDFWMCINTDCSYYQFYSHPCPGAGQRAYCEATVKKANYTTIAGDNSELLIDIDGYGVEHIELGTNVLMSGNDIAKVLGNCISTVNVGGYSFAQIDYTENEVIRITSGTNRNTSDVTIPYSKAAEELGFYNARQEPIFTVVSGTNPATGFDYASTRLLQTFEINALVDGDDNIAYVHNPSQYSVEGGRRDFNEIGTSKLISELDDVTGYESFDNTGKTILDLSKRIDNNGKLKHFWVYGALYSGAALKILRPHNDGSFTVVESVPLPMPKEATLYTAHPIVSRVDCDVLVNKGDILGIYNANLYVGKTSTGLPDATFIQVNGEASGRVYNATSYSYGVGGFAIYARGDLKQNNTILDIDLGYRLNVSEFIVSGEELEGYYEFNLASCLDITWNVNLFGETHNHSGVWLTVNGGTWYDTHNNIYYGKECLDDLVITADNGKAGDIYTQDNGLATSGDHAYFYVNGDFEWPYSTACTGLTEYCGVKKPTSGSLNYVTDPIAFTLLFPNEYKFDVHKSIIYFKEENNFRNIALSTYGGFYHYSGNADRVEYDLVPEYKYLYLNGVRYELGDNDNIDRYLFKNPATTDLYSQDYDDPEKCSDHISTYFVDWSILGHEFEPISCKGFRIYCNKHNSTKITEMEVYSRIPNDVSMVDNTVLHFSDYNDKWRTAGFKAIDDKTTSAFIGGTPRYFRVAFESQTPFNMREISITTTEQTYIEDPVVLLDEAKNGVISAGKALTITNTFDKAFDLTVDLPRDLISSKNIIFWNTLNSLEVLADPELGPTCFLYKSPDYPITYSRGQCATNCFSYGLCNLINGKQAYYSYNTLDWFSFGTLSSGVPLSFSNEHYMHMYKFSADITPVSSKYWRIQLLTSDRVCVLNDISVSYMGERVEIHKLLLPDTIPNTSLNYINTTGANLDNYYTFKDSFASGTWDEFSVFGTKTPSAHVIDDEYLYLDGKGGSINLSTYRFVNSDNFEFLISWYYTTGHPTYIYPNSEIRFEFYSAAEKIFYVHWTCVAGANVTACDGTAHVLKVFEGDTELYSNNTLGCYLNMLSINKMCLRKSGNAISIYLGEHIYVGTFYISSTKQLTSFYFRTTSLLKTVNIYNLSFMYRPMITAGTWLGLELDSNTPIDNIFFISTGNALTANFLSGVNNSNYSLVSTSALTRENLSIVLAIDLVKRHSLSIVRHYGIGYLFDVSLQLKTQYSNSSGNIEAAVFDSSYTDCRWLGIQIDCSDNIKKSIEKLGVYSDITKVFCKDGGLNNSWEPILSSLTQYTPLKNVALKATVSGTTYYGEFIPDKAVDGDFSNYGTEYCWAYEKGTTPILYVEFEDEYNIGSFTVHNGYSPNVPLGYNKGYKLYLDNTAIGSSRTWVLVYTAAGITNSAVQNHEFNYVKARRAKLEITSFETVEVPTDSYNSAYLNVHLGFLRELEIFAKAEVSYISSEDFPIVCVDLRDKFNIVDVKLYNSFQQTSKLLTNAGNTLWDNSSEFISYSDSLTDDPSQAYFVRGQDYTTEYESDFSTEDLKYSIEYLLVTSFFLAQGHHYVDWEAYYPQSVEEISLEFEGNSKIVVYADNYGTGWKTQQHEFFIENDGYFNIYTRQNIDSDNSWGLRNLKIYRLYDLTKWVAIVRDTATNYSYTFVDDMSSPDYLDKIEVYGGDKYSPTVYWWWWTSELATLSNNTILTKVGSRSLRIDYPASSEIDTLRLSEADHFGQDLMWSISDSLRFYLYIDDINNLDTTYGKVLLGSLDSGSEDFYYVWNIADIPLVSGWNEVKLHFYEYSTVYPTKISGSTTFLESILCLQNNDRNITTFYIQYRGVGNKLTMFLDGITILRNTFETPVKFNKGLCLTYSDYLMMPLSNINLDKGSVEFWVKMGVDTLGRDAFGEIHAATLFTLSSNTNDIVSLRIKPGNWFEVFAGNIRKQSLFSTTELPAHTFISRNSIVHIGLVWSNDGTGIAGGYTIKLFINGILTLNSLSTWDVSDTKISFFKLGGGITQTAQVYNDHSAFVFENVKVYNYCKEDFLVNVQGIDGEILYTPENFIQISKDNLNFYGVGSENLPLVFEQVPSQSSEIVYVRTVKDKKLKSTSSNAQIIVDWLTTV